MSKTPPPRYIAVLEALPAVLIPGAFIAFFIYVFHSSWLFWVFFCAFAIAGILGTLADRLPYKEGSNRNDVLLCSAALVAFLPLGAFVLHIAITEWEFTLALLAPMVAAGLGTLFLRAAEKCRGIFSATLRGIGYIFIGCAALYWFLIFALPLLTTAAV